MICSAALHFVHLQPWQIIKTNERAFSRKWNCFLIRSRPTQLWARVEWKLKSWVNVASWDCQLNYLNTFTHRRGIARRLSGQGQFRQIIRQRLQHDFKARFCWIELVMVHKTQHYNLALHTALTSTRRKMESNWDDQVFFSSSIYETLEACTRLHTNTKQYKATGRFMRGKDWFGMLISFVIWSSNDWFHINSGMQSNVRTKRGLLQFHFKHVRHKQPSIYRNLFHYIALDLPSPSFGTWIVWLDVAVNSEISQQVSAMEVSEQSSQHRNPSLNVISLLSDRNPRRTQLER